MKRLCIGCGCEFKPKRGRQRWHSKKCHGQSVSGPLHYRYKGGHINKSGYRMLCYQGRRKLEHRYLMEQHLGRPLLRNEVVHHKDGNRLNNAIENLEVLPSHAEHVARHYTGYRTETHKQCTQCHEIKPRTEFDAGRKREGSDPHHTQCKSCRSAYYAQRWKEKKTTAQHRYEEGWYRKHDKTWVKRDQSP